MDLNWTQVIVAVVALVPWIIRQISGSKADAVDSGIKKAAELERYARLAWDAVEIVADRMDWDGPGKALAARQRVERVIGRKLTVSEYSRLAGLWAAWAEQAKKAAPIPSPTFEELEELQAKISGQLEDLGTKAADVLGAWDRGLAASKAGE